MTWLVFSYSLPFKARSSPRVALWRRLRRLGAISPTGGMYLLPVREECLEAFQWLTEEVKQAKGEALVMHVEQFEGLSDAELMERFRQARADDYAELKAQADELEQSLRARLNPEERSRLQEALKKLQRRHADIARVDFFDAPEGSLVASALSRLEHALVPQGPTPVRVSSAPLAAYCDKRWVTRPRPHVDRLSCIWLIRRFINPQAVVRYSPTPEPGEVGFDMPQGEFTHRGHLCTFETMVRAFGLEDQVLQAMGEIIHEIDLRDGRYVHPETAGIDAVLKGWLLARLSDRELEAHGVALFEGLYADLSRRTRQSAPKPRGRKGQDERKERHHEMDHA
jgi:hypothetical protein